MISQIHIVRLFEVYSLCIDKYKQLGNYLPSDMNIQLYFFLAPKWYQIDLLYKCQKMYKQIDIKVDFLVPKLLYLKKNIHWANSTQ